MLSQHGKDVPRYQGHMSFQGSALWFPVPMAPFLIRDYCLHSPGASGFRRGHLAVKGEGTLGLNQALDLPREDDNTHVTLTPPQRDPGQCWPHWVLAPSPPLLSLLQPFFLLMGTMQKPHF